MPSDTILVTGGAGYIGSHCLRHLLRRGYQVVVVDNLSTGHRWAVPESVPFVEGNAGDAALISDLIDRFTIGAVIHFAGSIVAPESVDEPLKYYANNTCVTRNLIETCVRKGVSRFLFSSTAAVYGDPSEVPVPESAELKPISPYGTSKLLTEWMLRDVAMSAQSGGGLAGEHTPDFRYVCLRYFNVAGASDDGSIGQATPQATHLIKIASEAACGLRSQVSIFGTDYPTRDGTCIRDYIHVDDLADAHVRALDYLAKGGVSNIYNVGYGRGFTVREILRAMREVTGVDFEVIEGERRAGDPASLIADASAIRSQLGWVPNRNDVNLICRSAYLWEKQLFDKREQIQAGVKALREDRHN
jgi:UDP-glucose 4-epimerase